MAESADVVVIGAGHNGLVCACYLARAGLKVTVLERRAVPGGAVCTQEDILPGYKIDVGSSAHIMIHLTPILAELELASFGLEYLEMDPWASYPVLGERRALLFWRDVERTCASIAQFSSRDAATYRQFVRDWTELNEGIFETFLKPPSPGGLFWTLLRRNLTNAASRRAWSSLDRVRHLMAPYRQVIDECFENETVRCALEWLAAQAGPAPTEVASGDLVGWNVMIHRGGAKRAKGGSGALSQALVRCLEKHGGTVVTEAEVSAVRRDGSLWRIESAAGEYLGRAAVCAMHVQPFFLRLLRDCPPELAARVRALRVGNGFGMIVRHAVSELPEYTGDPEIDRACHQGLQLLCPSREHLMSSFIDYQAGRPPERPSVVAMTFSALDPTLAPEGRHTLFTWGQWHPFELSNGEQWDAIEGREADKLYALVERFAPNMAGRQVGRMIQSPLDLERRLGLVRGNVMHLEMSLDQMFFFRPLPELACYRAPLPQLYLTGASTHPGGGVFGASGRTAAQVVLQGLKARR